jgi:pimeloyl-ACP methyl ester carboxylesterase
VVPCLPEGHRTVVVDLLGHGRSDPPGGHAMTARAHADRLVRLLDLLGIDRACLVGHGLGATIANLVATHHSTRASRLCFVNASSSDHGTTSLLRAARYIPGPLLIGAARSRIQRGYCNAERANRSLDHYMRPFAATGGHAVIAAQLAAIVHDTITGEATNVPTAIIAGECDPFVAVSDAKALQASIPGATLELLSDAHYAPDESPERVAQVITQLLER